MKFYSLFSLFIKKNFARKKKWQKYFEMLHGFSESAMNYGYGSNFENSGELEALKYISSAIKTTHPVLFDVGANVGNYSLRLAEIFKSNCTIYSFEPAKKTFHILKQNTAKHKLINSFNIALGNSIGTLLLHTTEKNSETASLINREKLPEKYGAAATETINTDTTDNFCAHKNISHIDFIKIDVEGFETEVLKGCSTLLAKNAVHFIQFEFGLPCIDARVFFRDFWNLLHPQFKIYRIVKDGLYEISHYTPQLEIFETSNFIAERKFQ